MKRLLFACVGGIVVPVLFWASAMFAFTSGVSWLHRIAIVPYMAVWGFYYLFAIAFPPDDCTLCISLSSLIACLIADFIFYSLVTYVFLRWRAVADGSEHFDALNLQT